MPGSSSDHGWSFFLLDHLRRGRQHERPAVAVAEVDSGWRFSSRSFFLLRIPGFVRFFQSIGRHGALPGTAGEVLGATLCVIGVGCAIWARACLGRNRGPPMSVKVNPVLVANGPYAYLRHPIYAGLWLALLGSAIAQSAWWVVHRFTVRDPSGLEVSRIMPPCRMPRAHSKIQSVPAAEIMRQSPRGEFPDSMPAKWQETKAIGQVEFRHQTTAKVGHPCLSVQHAAQTLRACDPSPLDCNWRR